LRATLWNPLIGEWPVVYLVSYDLNRVKDYARLKEGISKTYPTSAKVLYSQYFVHTDQSAVQIKDALIKFVDADDGLLVTEVFKTSAAWRQKLHMNDVDMGKWIAAAR
jgi:hypothetical protein